MNRLSQISATALLLASSACAASPEAARVLEIDASDGKSDISSTGFVSLDEHTEEVQTHLSCSEEPGCHFVVYVPLEEPGLTGGELMEHEVGTVSIGTGLFSDRVELPLSVEVAEPRYVGLVTEVGPHPLYWGAAYLNHRVVGPQQELSVSVTKYDDIPSLLLTIRVDFEQACSTSDDCRSAEVCHGQLCRPACDSDAACEPEVPGYSEPVCVAGACEDRQPCDGSDVTCGPGQHCDPNEGRCVIVEV